MTQYFQEALILAEPTFHGLWSESWSYYTATGRI